MSYAIGTKTYYVIDPYINLDTSGFILHKRNITLTVAFGGNGGVGDLIRGANAGGSSGAAIADEIPAARCPNAGIWGEKKKLGEGRKREAGSRMRVQWTAGYNAVRHMQYSARQASAVRRSAAQCSTIQYSPAQYSQSSTVQYNTVQYSTAQHSTAQHSTVQGSGGLTAYQ